ncbi:hypothetical protein L1987_24613 [Smallanthus sonchifolius]|uniref:Uncharacterized protein n=1 Tax=Smallanthus sonchifolius TaxID=185202 RepID=A0ACB9ILI3_9ASTR|nr:hypothetical protein L1987_24613 [Smallanthus sonchifolius]
MTTICPYVTYDICKENENQTLTPISANTSAHFCYVNPNFKTKIGILNFITSRGAEVPAGVGYLSSCPEEAKLVVIISQDKIFSAIESWM